jgi:hypothetical protein
VRRFCFAMLSWTVVEQEVRDVDETLTLSDDCQSWS